MRVIIKGNAETGNKLAIETEAPQVIETVVPLAIETAVPEGIDPSRPQAESGSIPVAGSRLEPVIAVRAAIKARVEIVWGTEAFPVAEDLVTRVPLGEEAEGPVGAAPA